MSLDHLFEPDPDPVARLVNIAKETSQGPMGDRIGTWLRQSPTHVYIGRGSIWGNPYSHLVSSAAAFQVRSRKEAIDQYRDHLERSGLMSQIEVLRGMVMGCWCLPKRCHGEILMEMLCQLQIK